ncbi:MAG: hypothetical protein IJP92_00805 [Lachnospiraceae bacterium]|nr:hypothetical protein [Lachnospiraceae bacterium]
MYKALVLFRDTQDKGTIYQPGDTYPREGYYPAKERVDLLLSDQNRQGRPVIELAKAERAVEEAPSETAVESQAKPKRGRKKSE